MSIILYSAHKAQRPLVLPQQQERETSNKSTIRTPSPRLLFRRRLSAQPQRWNSFSARPSTYREPFLGYFSKSCAISARSSVDSSTSPLARFSEVRFAFLRPPRGVHGEGFGRWQVVKKRKLTRIQEAGSCDRRARRPTRCTAARP